MGAQVRSADRSPAPDIPVRAAGDGSALYRSQVAHDIRHELGTIMMLASALVTSKDLGRTSRDRVLQLIAEAQRLDELIRAYDSAPGTDGAGGPVRLDALVGDIVRCIELSGAVRISIDTKIVYVNVDRLSLWRAVRNVVCNALAAAGPQGSLAARVWSADGYAAIEIDDDGPGFGQVASLGSSHGLAIVEEVVAAHGGWVEIGRSDLGGCRVRLLLPEHDATGTGTGAVRRARCAM